MQVDARLQVYRPANEPFAGWNDNAAAPGSTTRGQRLVDRWLAIGLAVADGAEVADLEVTLGELRRLDAREDLGHGAPSGLWLRGTADRTGRDVHQSKQGERRDEAHG